MGKWIGQFTYGKDYPETVTGKSVDFEMDIIQNGVAFDGTVTDEITKEHQLEPATISGMIENMEISFIKTYSCLVVFNEQGILRTDPDSPAFETHYSGTWIDDHFEGDWYAVKELNEQEDILSTQGSGTWAMHKV